MGIILIQLIGMLYYNYNYNYDDRYHPSIRLCYCLSRSHYYTDMIGTASHRLSLSLMSCVLPAYVHTESQTTET